MATPPAPPLTVLLQAWEQGDKQAFGQRIAQVHGELRGMALTRLRGVETPSLAAGDLLQETLLKLAYFGGLKRDDIATVLALSVPTVDRELRFARAWLSTQLRRQIEA